MVLGGRRLGRGPRCPRAPGRCRHLEPTGVSVCWCLHGPGAARMPIPTTRTPGPMLACPRCGCCTLARTPRRQKSRNHEEKQCRWWPRSCSHVRRPPSPHMGARPPHTMIARKSRDSNKIRPSPRRGPGLPYATPRTTASAMPTCSPHPLPRTVVLHIPPRDRSDSARPTRRRDAHDKLGAKATWRTSEPAASSRSATARPISMRNRTDLGAGYDRSRRMRSRFW